MQKVLPDAGGIATKTQLAALALKLVIVFLPLKYSDMPPLWAPLPDH